MISTRALQLAYSFAGVWYNNSNSNNNNNNKKEEPDKMEYLVYDTIFFVDTKKEATIEEVKAETQNKHSDLLVVEVFTDSSKKRFAVFAIKKNK